MSRNLFKFTPALEDPHSLKAVSVGRNHELKRLLQAIGEGARRKGNQHFLLVGPRGIGKTHLLLLIYHSVKGTISWNDLSRNLSSSWIPVLFAEEEYRITSLGDLLLEVLIRLKEEAPDEQLLQLIARLEQVPLPGEEEKELALEYLAQKRSRDGKGLLLLLDNLQDMLPHFTEEDQGRLRDILMTKDLFMLIGTAPTLFDTVIKHEAPFYNFFEVIWLQEIGEEQVKVLIERRLNLDGRNDLLKNLGKYEDRLKALVHLTGGNPRLILSLYQIFTQSKIIEVERDFIKLLDEMTPYFQDRMKELSPQQRKVIDAVALMDGPSTPTEIARFARLRVNVTNSQLKRLKEAGFVKAIKERKRRETLYEISERLFRLWRQMRVEAGRRRLRFIVRFIEIWFTPQELTVQIEEISKELMTALATSAFERVKNITAKLYYIQEAAPPAIRIKAHLTRIYGLAKVGDLQVAAQEAKNLLVEARAKDDNELLAAALWENAFISREQRDPELTLEYLRDYLELKPGNAYAWNNTGATYTNKGEHDEAIRCFQKAVEIKPDQHAFWYNMGLAYAEKGEHDEAISCYRKAVKFKPDMHEAWYNMGLAYAEKGELDEAIRCYQKTVGIKPDDGDAWNSMGNAYSDKGKHDAAIAAYSKAIDIAKQAGVMEALVGNLANRIGSYLALGKYSLALKEAKTAYPMALKLDVQPLISTTASFGALAALALSRKSVIRRNPAKAVEHLKRALNYVPDTPAEEAEKIIGQYFRDLLGAGNRALAEETLQAIEKSGQNNLIEFLMPYRAALRYMETKDKSVLNRLPSEIREIVEDMVTKLEGQLP
ncbi:MAG: tetratricopeptide repeat protein [Nitrospiraceae bacterium]|nr:tetratricopeptide repeat protein [Nitrospiraceae bacterium]